jgi:hypothetical protein
MLRKVSGHVRSNVVGYVAVFLALTGTAIALPGKNSVNSGDIKNNQVKSVDAKDGGLRLKDLAVQVTTVTQNFSTVGSNSCQGISKDVPKVVRPTDYVLVLPPAGVGGDEDYYGGALTVNGGPPGDTAAAQVELRICNPTGAVGVDPPNTEFRVLVFR